MTDLYLIAHKVHGEPAFDIASRIECAECKQDDGDVTGCPECDQFGYWWVIPTSGHRAHPYWNTRLDGIEFEGDGNYHLSEELANMPPNLPDHYLTRSAPAPARPSGLDALLKRKPAPQNQPPLPRRGY